MNIIINGFQWTKNRSAKNARQNKCGFPGSLAHARKVFETCYELNKWGEKFYTEAVFKNGCRADIFVLDTRQAIEVLESESEESIQAKRTKYPCEIVTIKTGAD